MTDWCLEHPVMTFLLVFAAIVVVGDIGVAIAKAARARRKEKL